MNKKALFDNFKKMLYPNLIIFGLGFVFLCIMWFVFAKNESTNMEKTIQHAENIKPIVFEKIMNEYPTLDIKESDLIFSLYNSSTSVFRHKSDYERRSGSYCYILDGKEIRIFIDWEKENNNFFINTIKLLK